MKPKAASNPANPKVVAAMAVGTVVALGMVVSSSLELLSLNKPAKVAKGKMSLAGSLGNTVILDCQIDPTGRFVSGRVHSYKQIGSGEPHPDPKRLALAELIARTKADFPETGARFRSDGTFSYA